MEANSGNTKGESPPHNIHRQTEQIIRIIITNKASGWLRDRMRDIPSLTTSNCEKTDSG